ncbi:hypothetical protein [Arthrobacter sp. CJ23]|uniref:hypothetical protein n=1 Tax=Arthrobacter sp. CJ23 TaxID=2972479 RepID=UPI00215C64F8|nr:hypothetical protein [Arthrobacter sp. CJ23]UVJ38938.1 hypothetical protein NVV90_17245 [Arthrobacter sp. CJ23]
MNNGWQLLRSLLQGALIGRRSRSAKRKVERGEDRTFRLRAASQFHVRELLFGGADRLHYVNRRFSKHMGQYDLGRINIHETLWDLYAEAEINAALVRADALINDAWRSVGYEPGAGEARMQQLRHAHAGFNNESIHKAMDWGYLLNR